MLDVLHRNLNLYFPFIVDNAEEYYEKSDYELIVKLKDGSYVSYNNLDNTIRRLPKDFKAMNKQQCLWEFGKRLRYIMLDRGMTQSKLSKLTDIPQNRISDYINGRVGPSFYSVDKIAKALNCSTDDLRIF